MKEILDRIHEQGYATIRDHASLADRHVQEALAEIAEKAGLVFSYDALTHSATFVYASKDPKYGLQERVTILNAWLFLVFRAKTNVTTEQDDQWLRLTPEGRRAMRENQEMSLTPGRLHTAFPNLYPTSTDAQRALTRLERRGLLSSQDESGIKTFVATPLLSHVIDEDEAISLVFGHLRGEYKHLMPAGPQNASLESQVLHLIKTLRDGTATVETIAKRLSKPKREVRKQLDKLRAANLVIRDEARRGVYMSAGDDLEDEDRDT